MKDHEQALADFQQNIESAIDQFLLEIEEEVAPTEWVLAFSGINISDEWALVHVIPQEGAPAWRIIGLMSDALDMYKKQKSGTFF